ncbi:MAG: DUF5683 domain-containing protein [Candidatus Cloacimonadaceae bacterium]|nr:DUF5683 domain-containing protein [Candidatus Cloacimonadaceae bacterium]
MKKTLIILFVLIVGLGLYAQKQGIDDMLFEEDNKSKQSENLDNDIIRFNFEKKNARRAMLYSAILPGAGQFYTDPSAIMTWGFPVIEIAMIGGIVYFSSQGNSKTKDLEKFANGEIITQVFDYTVNGVDYSYTYTGTRYNMTYQNQVQQILKSVNAYDIYDDGFFRLDATNTQHFYEDIGKYNKYVFGWADWYHTFATDPTQDQDCVLGEQSFVGAWVWTGSTDPQLIHLRRWTGNHSIENYLNDDLDSPVSPGSAIATPWRQEYIQMRKDANTQYGHARLFTLGLAFNHITSAVHAVLQTNRVNRKYLSDTGIKLQPYATVRDDQFTPMLGFTLKY